jgi:hypothetical protein
VVGWNWQEFGRRDGDDPKSQTVDGDRLDPRRSLACFGLGLALGGGGVCLCGRSRAKTFTAHSVLASSTSLNINVSRHSVRSLRSATSAHERLQSLFLPPTTTSLTLPVSCRSAPDIQPGSHSPGASGGGLGTCCCTRPRAAAVWLRSSVWGAAPPQVGPTSSTVQSRSAGSCRFQD